MIKKNILNVYCIGSIPVDSGLISIYDLETKKIKKSFEVGKLIRDIISKKK